MRKREDGTLGLTAGGGSANRRSMIKVVRRELNLDKLLRERGFADDDDEAQEASDAPDVQIKSNAA